MLFMIFRIIGWFKKKKKEKELPCGWAMGFGPVHSTASPAWGRIQGPPQQAQVKKIKNKVLHQEL
jgi:hypothetical protein